MTTFAITYTYDERTAARDELRPAHRAHLRGLHDDGVLLASGPLAPGALVVEQGRTEALHAAAGALLLVRADSAEEAVRLLDDDPFWTGGLISTRTARPWDPVIGPWAG